MFEFHTMVMGFQRRYWWQLSSLLDQDDPPPIKVVFSVTERDPHFHWNERIIETFSDHLDVEMDVWGADDQRYGRRGEIRTRSLRNAQSDFVVFNDGDMVYAPDFMKTLTPIAEQHKADPRVLGAGRVSMDFETGYKLVGQEAYGGIIENAYGKSRSMDTRLVRRCSGAGYFQCVSMRALREKFGDDLHYAGSHKDNDTFQTTHITRSDRSFRLHCGGVIPVPELTEKQVHLNHYRRQDKQWDPYHVH